MSKLILNLGSGRKLIKGAINIDMTQYDGVDQVVDLSHYPWLWADNCVDEIHASHIIEHFPDSKQFVMECYRILKPGGTLRLSLPHSSSVTSVGCFGHYRTFSYSTMRQYLSNDYYMFGKKKFETVEQKLNWWYECPDAQGELTRPILCVILAVNPIINFLARLSPHVCENLWCFWVGGMREVIWKGKKI